MPQGDSLFYHIGEKSGLAILCCAFGAMDLMNSILLNETGITSRRALEGRKNLLSKGFRQKSYQTAHLAMILFPQEILCGIRRDARAPEGAF
jgi:hypothetical protein